MDQTPTAEPAHINFFMQLEYNTGMIQIKKQTNIFMKNNKGFTLIELLVVISIIGLLSSVVFAGLNTARVKSRDAKRLQDLKQIRTALEIFYDQQGRYPAPSGGTCYDLCTGTSHWAYAQQCLETGAECGFSPVSYQPVMSKVPADPLDDPASVGNRGNTVPAYYIGYGASAGPDKYVLRTLLETTNHSALSSDADGDFMSAGDGLCNGQWYCIKVNF